MVQNYCLWGWHWYGLLDGPPRWLVAAFRTSGFVVGFSVIIFCVQLYNATQFDSLSLVKAVWVIILHLCLQGNCLKKSMGDVKVELTVNFKINFEIKF